MKKKLLFLCLVVLFFFTLFFTLGKMEWVFRNKDYSGAQDRFREWDPEEADIVFIGNSHQFCSINPDVLYYEYGLESFMLATSAQTIPMSYYAAMEAIELRHPRQIILELSYMANDFMTVGYGMDNSFFDGMPPCHAKTAAINDLYEEDQRIYYYLPLGLYHTRWKELSEKDYRDFELSERGTYLSYNVAENWEIPLADPSDREAPPENMVNYLKKLVDLCKENDVELVCYVAPFNSTYDDEPSNRDLLKRERIFNQTCLLLEDMGITARNLFYELDAIGLDPTSDWMDSQHLNINGQAKFTRYLADTGLFGEDVRSLVNTQ